MSIKFTILGCGSSLGVPRIDGNFGKCNPKNKKNYRTRCSALISSSQRNILIDTSPDIKFQLLKNKIKNINNVFYTHAHADQTHGINEMRAFYIINKKKLPVYGDKITKKLLLSTFKYCFKGTQSYPATLKFNNLNRTHIFRRINQCSIARYDEIFPLVKTGSFMTDDIPDRFKLHIQEANATSFMPCSQLAEIEKETKAV